MAVSGPRPNKTKLLHCICSVEGCSCVLVLLAAVVNKNDKCERNYITE